MSQAIKSYLKRHALGKRLLKARREGVLFSLARWELERRILRSPPVHLSPLCPPPCEVRILLYDEDWRMALWAAKSFYHYSQVQWPLVWQEGGPLRPKVRQELLRHFPQSEVLTLEEADAKVEAELERRGLTATLQVRRTAVYLRKPVDFALLSSAPRALLLDTDVLFFREPVELVEAVTSARLLNYFNEDASNGYPMTPEEAQAAFGIRPMERINAGLCLVCRESIRLEEVERFLQDPRMKGKYFTDQLVYALLAASFPTCHLPQTYVLSARPGLEVGGAPAVARHYAGTTRRLLFTEGMPRLVEQGLLHPCPL